MRHFNTLLAIIAFGIILAGCTGNSGNPVLPLEVKDTQQSRTQTHLWGYYDVYFDVENRSLIVVPSRGGMFSANVVNFLNNPVTNMGFKINDTPTDPGGTYVDVDIDVSLTHPFPGMNQYNGYDVRGVFIGNASGTMNYNPDLIYARYNSADPVMYDYNLSDPLKDGHGNKLVGNPDGYTRWYNPSEFPTAGLFGYVRGKLATPAPYNPNGTLNPYKYFADDLGVEDDLWTWLNVPGNASKFGVFSAGKKNTRNYYLRFPLPNPGVKYGYAVVANWEAPEIHPSNAIEPICISVTVTPDLYYTSPTQKGGKLILDASIYAWGAQPSTIWVESTVISAPKEFAASSIVVGTGGEHYSTYHVEIPADNLTSKLGNEFWVIAECSNADYTNPFGIPNYAGTDKLAAFFRKDLEVGSEPPCKNWVPVVSKLNGKTTFLAVSKPYTGWIISGDSFEKGTPEVTIKSGSTVVANGTNVQYVDVNTLTFDINLTGVPYGTYDVVVANGCGQKKTGIGKDMLKVLNWIRPVGTPNIDVVTGYGAPTDITCDPSSDKTAISYATTWKVWSNNYQTASPTYNSYQSRKFGPMDAQSHLIWYAIDYPPYINQPLAWSWADFTGWQSSNGQWQPGTECRMYDMANIQGSNEIRGVYNWYGQGVSSVGTTANYSLYLWYHTHMGTNVFFNGLGTQGVVVANLRAIDFAQFDGTNYDIYFLEALPDSQTGVAELWRFHYNPTYKNISIGEGIIGDPRDITVDSNYNVYILEKNSAGFPVIWAWNAAGELIGTSEPVTSSVISGNPLRMDCSLSKDPDEVHVLHSLGVTRFTMY